MTSTMKSVNALEFVEYLSGAYALLGREEVLTPGVGIHEHPITHNHLVGIEYTYNGQVLARMVWAHGTDTVVLHEVVEIFEM